MGRGQGEATNGGRTRRGATLEYRRSGRGRDEDVGDTHTARTIEEERSGMQPARLGQGRRAWQSAAGPRGQRGKAGSKSQRESKGCNSAELGPLELLRHLISRGRGIIMRSLAKHSPSAAHALNRLDGHNELHARRVHIDAVALWRVGGQRVDDEALHGRDGATSGKDCWPSKQRGQQAGAAAARAAAARPARSK